MLCLVVVDGSEIFDILKNGEVVDEFFDFGEVVWCDDFGVICCCWNWCQGVCICLDVSVWCMWFIFESLLEMLLVVLYEVGGLLFDELCLMMFGMCVDLCLLCVVMEFIDSV